jgi:hypothetical protein
MPKYFYNGKEFSEDELSKAAEQSGVTIDEYISKAGIEIQQDEVKKEEVVQEDFQTDPAKETASAGSMKTAVDTESTLADGSSEQIDASDFKNTQEKNTWLEDYWGKTELTDFVGDIYRAWDAGTEIGGSVNEAFNVYKGQGASDEELYAFLEKTRKIESKGQSDEAIAASKKQQQLKEEGYNGVQAFFLGWWDNPTWMAQTAIQSFSQMARALVDSEEVIGAAAASSGVGAAGGAALGSTGFAFGPTGLVTTPVAAGIGATAGFFGGLSGAMETAMTTAQLVQEQAEEDGYDWGAMNDKSRFDYIRNLQSDKEKFDDIKSRAIARGITIGAIDGITAGLTGGAGGVAYKTVAAGARSSLANVAKVATAAAVETAGGMASEVAGQAAAGQEFNLEEVLIEGFADKTFTSVSLVQSTINGGPKYNLNGQEINGKEMSDALKIMSDEAYVQADIKIENSPAVEQLVNNRRSNIAADQKVDSRISDVDDRAKAIDLVKEQRKLSNNKEGNKTRLNQIKNELDVISEKYANAEVDATIQERQDAVALAVDNKFEASFNKNYEAAADGGKKIGLKTVLYKTDNGYKKAIERQFGELPKGWDSSDGVFAGDGKLFINKAQAKRSIDIATGNTGAISVASHEVLHPIFNALIGGATAQGNFVNEFRTRMTGKQKAWIDSELKARGYDESVTGIELMNVFSDGIIKNQISYDQTLFEKLGDSILRLFKGQGFDNLSFDNGKEVYNFLKEYNTSIKEGKLSEKAIDVIKKSEEKKGVKVSEAELLEKEAQFSQTKLTPEVSNAVAEKIQKINKLEQKGQDFAASIDRDFIKSGQQQTLENELSQLISPAVEALAESTTKRLYDRISTEQKRNVSREEYKQSLKADWIAMVINEYDAAKQDIEKFLSTRGNLRANSLAKKLGIESAEQGGIKKDVTEQKNLMADKTTVEIEKAPSKLINPTDLITNPDTKNKYIEAVKSKIKDLTPKQLSFKALKDLAPDITAELFGVPVKKIIDPTANLSTGDLSAIQNFINKNADALLKLLPEGGIDYKKAASERLLGTSTGVPTKLLDAFYDPKPRVTKGAGLAIQKKRKGITRSEFLEAFGIVDGKKLTGLSPRSGEAQAMKGMAALFGRIMTNTVVRQEMSKQPGTEAAVQDIAAGKSDIQFSKTLASEMSSEKRDIFWAKKNKNKFKALIKDDPKNIGNHFKEVYGYTFENVDLIAKELNTEYKNWKKLSPENRDNIEEHILNHIASFGFRSQLRNLLSLGKNSLNFRDKDQIENARKALVKLAKSITEEEFIKYLLPTLQTGYGLIGGKYTAVKDKNSDGYILIDVNEDGSKNLRYHLVSGRADAVNKLLDGAFEGETSYVPNSKTVTINGKKVNTLKFTGIAQDANDFVSGKFEENLKKRKEFAEDQRKGMLLLSTKLQELLNNEDISGNDLGMILMTFSSNPSSLIRTAAIPSLKFDGNFLENTEFVYEHSKPAREVLVEIADLIFNNKLEEKTYKNVMEDYIVTILPKAYDDIINKFYKDFSPINEKGKYVESKKNKPARYFEDKVTLAIKMAGLPELKLIPLGKKSTRKILFQFNKTSKENKEKILNKQFNDILQNKTGIASEKEYSDARAEVVGASKGKFNWFIPPTAEDFVGLLYQFLGKGKEGDKQMAWFKVNLLNPYARAMSGITRERVSIARNYRALKKELKIVPKNLKKKVPGEDFTVEQALRVHIWGKQGYDVPGLDNADRKSLNDYINSKPELVEFADKMILLNKDYAKPKDSWLAGTLTTDMLETLNTTRRAEFLKEWQENVDVVFSDKNLNKIEAAYGSSFRYALENILTRMKTGRNRSYGTDSLTGRVTDWLTNSIGAIMFFNTRSAVLQTLSAVNFINFGSNNILAAGKAFANQKQFWADFKTLYNSDFLVDRRDGLRLNVNESDIADMAKNGGVKGVVAELLKLGFTPTQIADSFAISSGGATFYRNTLNQYLKEGVDPKVAEELAFREFREIAEESQQSSRPDRISAQQAGPLGRIILAFANTPAQYARLIKKAASDLKNGRGDAKTNVSKLIYYGVAQNLIFNAMQQALFAMAFGDDEEEEETEQKKYINIANGMSDSILRGMGISGAIVSVLKNTAKKLIERSENKQPDYAENALMELLKISPPVSSKASKIKNALRSYEWDKDEMYEKGLALDNPAYLAAGNVLSAATNIPLDRVIKKVTNVKDAMDEDVQLWQRIAMIAGWQAWELGIKEEKKTKSKDLLESKKKFKSRDLLKEKKSIDLLKK